ncbi:MAG: hypothetical protein WA208_04230 [Thermoanaerobaculia bacterium]
MKTLRRGFILLTLAVFGSCAPPASQPSAVPLLGTAADIARFIGSWSGTLNTDGREEPIDFRIAPAAGGPPESVVLTRSGGGAKPLLYLRVTGSTLVGAANPHFEERCNCSVYVTIRGELAGDVLQAEIQRTESRRRVVTATFTARRTQ